MGEIADMMIDGILDYETGEYLGKAVGYPRTRKQPNTNLERQISAKPLRDYLRSQTVPQEKYTEIVREYFVTILKRSKNKSLNQMCEIIVAENFKEFKQWFKNK